jgi:uncharacterized protein DUF2786
MNASSAALIGKIRKLLAKAERTDNGNEAEAFAAKAAQLIAEHRIEPDHVRDAVAHGELGLRRIALGRGAYVRARLALLVAIARHHDCEVVYETGSDGTTAIVAGYEADLDVTEVLYTSLLAQATSRASAARGRTPAATQRWRRSFLFGFAEQVTALLESARTDAAEAARRRPPSAEDAAPAAHPDVLARAARVREFAASSFGRVSAARAPAPAQVSGWRDGQRAASGADLGRTRLAGRPALKRGG